MVARGIRGLLLWRRPAYLVRRIAYEIYRWRHPKEPWLAQGAIRFLDAHLNREMIGFEWGSGRSTAWLGHRLGKLVSIEQEADWHATVPAQLKREGLMNVDCKLIPIQDPKNAPTGAHYDPLPRYVAVILDWPAESLDLVLVDGHYRLACIPQAVQKVKAGGYLVIDNTNWPYAWAVPPPWPMVHRSINVASETTIWQKPLGGRD